MRKRELYHAFAMAALEAVDDAHRLRSFGMNSAEMGSVRVVAVGISQTFGSTVVPSTVTGWMNAELKARIGVRTVSRAMARA